MGPWSGRALIARLLVSALALSFTAHCHADRTLNHAGWVLSWHDEFEGTVLDSGSWNVDSGSNAANNELQWYSPENVSVTNGNLVIKSELRSTNGFNYVSGKVNTFNKRSQRYGRFDIGAKLPEGRGLWPAHWMLPSSLAWPPEIDIMELFGNQPDCAVMSHHWGPVPPGQKPWDIGQTVAYTYCGHGNLTTDWHHFGVEWDATSIKWFVDGVQRFVSATNTVPQTSMWLILNTAIGGDAGIPDPTNVWPQYHQIDYVRAFQPRPPEENYLLNPGFEAGAGLDFDNWNSYAWANVQRDSVPDNVRTGAKAVQMWGRFPGNQIANISGLYQDLWAAPGETWRASVWARNRPGDAAVGENNAKLKLEFVDSYGGVVAQNARIIITSATTNSTAYSNFVVEAKAPAGTTRARIVLEYYQRWDADGSVNFDDAQLARLAPAVDSLDNGGFEQYNQAGRFMGWSVYDNIHNTIADPQASHAHSGTNAVQMWGRYPDDYRDNTSGLFQDRQATNGQLWIASVWARNRPGDVPLNTNEARLKLEFRDANGIYLPGSVGGTILTTGSPAAYAHFSFRAQAPTNTAFARIVLEYFQSTLNSTNAPGSVNFDDAALTLMTFDMWIAGYLNPASPDAAPGADPDNDGVTNEGEFSALTNPTNIASVLRITSLSPAAGGGYNMTWNAAEGVRYRILATSDPGILDPNNPAVEIVATGLTLTGSNPQNPGESGPLTHLVQASTARRFYVIEVVPGG